MDPRPPRTPWLLPYLAVRDAKRSIEFYKKAFGFKSKTKPDKDGQIHHAEMIYKNNVLFMFAPEGAMGDKAKSPASSNNPPPQMLYVYVDNVDKIYQTAIANGARGTMEPQDTYWGDRMCAVVDIDGYAWGFGKLMKKKSTKKKSVKKKVKKASKSKVTKKKSTEKPAKKKTAKKKAIKKKKK
ncbi:VOC family protein [Fluviispira multicolorata]|uniref:VOC family protein n=1 Tax=Fluviispira multicolorata TaxID=2654512 RepID=A0A833N432_9BACT|nr:glyoxalase/bleomycin resistance/extradiol dioxygenase family protein [Fluviispira multicolorata]KAB8029851.1 VOC family protein [Fluviispira multicolorata]